MRQQGHFAARRFSGAEEFLEPDDAIGLELMRSAVMKPRRRREQREHARASSCFSFT